MRLIFISRKYPPSVGGMQLFSRDLYTALSKTHDVSLVKWGGSNLWLPIVLPALFLKSIYTILKSKPEIIHMQDGLLAPMGYLLSKIFRRPYVVIIHGLDITHPNPLYQKLIVPFVRRANKVICISGAAKEQCLSRGVSNHKVSVITLAVNDAIYQKSSREKLDRLLKLPPNNPVLLTVGRLVKRKGVNWFVDQVMPQLCKANPSLIYLIAGEGSERPEIHKTIQKHSLDTNVRMLGRTSDELLAAAYNGADIFVMPNINVAGDIEGFGLVSLEASLCRVPVVASNTEGITDAISDGNNGFLISVEDSTGFRDKIQELISSPKQTKIFGKKSRQYTLDHYRWDSIADKYTQEYLQLTSQNT